MQPDWVPTHPIRHAITCHGAGSAPPRGGSSQEPHPNHTPARPTYDQVMGDGEGGDLTRIETSKPGPQLNTRLVIGSAVLIGVGGLLGLIGTILGSSELLAATRRWVHQLETQPSELARRKWEQARAATMASADAWREGPATDG